MIPQRSLPALGVCSYCWQWGDKTRSLWLGMWRKLPEGIAVIRGRWRNRCGALSIAAFWAAAGLLPGGAASLNARTVESLQERFNVAPDARLVVDIGWGDIELSATRDLVVSIEIERRVAASSDARERDLLEEDGLEVTQRADVVTVRSERVSNRRSFMEAVRGIDVERNYVYRITVPERFQVDLSTRMGGVSVKGMRGDLKMTTRGGGARLEDLSGRTEGRVEGGPVEIVGSGGEVSLQVNGAGVEAWSGEGTLRLQVTGGDIVIHGHRGLIDARAQGGEIVASGIEGAFDGETAGSSIRVAFAQSPTGDSRLASFGGGIAVSLPAGAGLVLDALSEGGSVRSDLPVASNEPGKPDQLKGLVQNGGPLLHLRSRGGHIRVLRQTDE